VHVCRTPRTALTAMPLVTALVLALAGCSAGAGTAGSAPVEGVDSLAVGLTAEPASLDFTTSDGAAIPEALLYNVVETLVKVDAASGDVVPLLAESYEVSADGREYAFTLHEGVTFSNGDAFTAEDVAFSIERVQSPAWTVSLKAAMDVVDEVEVVSPTEVVVRLARPDDDWLYRMTTRVGGMFSETGVDDLANAPVGTGPYTVTARTRGDSLSMEVRDDYWGAQPEVERVVLRYFEDGTALENALVSGGIDVIGNLQTPESLSRFRADDRFQVVEGTTNGELVLSMGARGPLQDRALRQALLHALDRQALLDTTYDGTGELIGSLVPPTDPWFDPALVQRYPYDPARARELLAASGTPLPELAFKIPNFPYAVNAAQVIAAQLAEVGVTARIEVLEFPVWLDVVFTQHDYDLSLVAHVEPRDLAIFADPDYYFGYDSPRYRELLAEASTAGAERAVELRREAAALLAEDAAAGFLFVLPNLIVAETDVQGLPVNRVSESLDLTGVSRG
jgi:peptide/nickel transport system substrate-binding protein